MAKKRQDPPIVPIPRAHEIKAAVRSIAPQLYISDCRECLLIVDDENDREEQAEFRIYPNHFVTFQARDRNADLIQEPEVTEQSARILMAIHGAIKAGAA